MERIDENFNNLDSDLLGDIDDEISRASEKFREPYKNGHEAFAILLEETQELWEEIKNDRQDRKLQTARMYQEAVQAIAVLIRFIQDVVNKEQ